MSRVDHIDKVWAEQGEKVEPGDAQINSGWQPGQEPPSQHENWKSDRLEVITNQLVHQNNTQEGLSAQLGRARSTSGTYSYNPTGNTWSVGNATVGESGRWINFCRGYNHSLGRECVFAIDADDVGNIIEFRQGFDGEIVREAHAINLPANFTPDSMCCDSYFLYIYGTGDPTLRFQIIMISISPWDANPIWHRIGGAAQLTITSGANDQQGRNKIICANDDYLAFLMDGDNKIGILAKNNAVLLVGDGNRPTGTFFEVLPDCLVAHNDDVYNVHCVYFFYNSGPGEWALCAADIADPTQATLDGTPFTSTTLPPGEPGTMATDGDVIAFGTKNNYLNFYVPSFDLTATRSIQIPSAWNIDFTYEEDWNKTTYDGRYFWTHHHYYHSGSNAGNAMLIAYSAPSVPGAPETIEEGIHRIFLGHPLLTSPNPQNVTNDPKFIFADDAVWLAKQSFHVGFPMYRIPMNLLRR